MLISCYTLIDYNVAIPSVLSRLSTFSPHRLRSTVRFASSKQWVDRQFKDRFARQARVQGLKSRAAFKLLQINEKYRLFKPGQTVIDLGYAPGSWSQVQSNTLKQFEFLPICLPRMATNQPWCTFQVAVDMTKPSGRVLGVDLIPAQPPKGVSTIQGNFLSSDVQASIRSYLRDPDRGRTLRPQVYTGVDSDHSGEVAVDGEVTKGYIDRERQDSLAEDTSDEEFSDAEKTVDVVLSDMCEPWEQTSGFFNRTLSDPYLRMMNTSGNAFRDHAGSMVSVCLQSHRIFVKVWWLPRIPADDPVRICVVRLYTSASTP